MLDFRKLEVWQKAHAFVLEVYKCTAGFPPSELYGLADQLRRAAVSIPTNIAEGCGRDTENELIRFMDIAQGSAFEVDYLLQLAHDLNYINEDIYKRLNEKIIQIKKMLFAYGKQVRSNRRKN